MTPITPKIKEIWYVDLNPIIGHEQSGERPAIVVSRAPKLKMVMVIPLTGASNSARFPYTLQIKNTTKFVQTQSFTST